MAVGSWSNETAGNVESIGGRDDDWLSGTGDIGSSPLQTEFSVSLSGRGGNDHLYGTLRTDNIPDSYDLDWTFSCLLDGGNGHDSLWANLGGFGDRSATIYGGSGHDIIKVSGDAEDEASVFADVSGGSGNDQINLMLGNYSTIGAGSGPVVRIDGGTGMDVINSWIYGSTGDSTAHIFGGDGDDAIHSFAGSESDFSGLVTNSADGGAGDDSISLISNALASHNTVLGGDGADSITVEASGQASGANLSAQNELRGGSDDDVMSATIYLRSNPEFEAVPVLGVNELYGDDGDDSLEGVVEIDGPVPEDGDFRSDLYGGAGNDRLKVSGGFGNTLWGNGGDDTLLGSGNSDSLIGGQGADYLRGGGGEDSFEFWGARGLSARERDRIEDFTIGEDLIDVSRIDANVFRSGNQAFRFNSSPDDWQGTGRLWVEDNPDNDGSIVYASTGRKMFAVNLMDGADVHASDYSAGDFIL